MTLINVISRLDKLSAVVDQLRGLAIPRYTVQSYNPAWTCLSGGDPSIGNGTIVGKYWVIGKIVTATVVITMGSSTTFGGGKWRISAPITAAASLREIGTALAADYSPSVGYVSVCQMASTSLINIIGYNTGGYDASIPITWTTSDRLALQISYEAA